MLSFTRRVAAFSSAGCSQSIRSSVATVRVLAANIHYSGQQRSSSYSRLRAALIPVRVVALHPPSDGHDGRRLLTIAIACVRK